MKRLLIVGLFLLIPTLVQAQSSNPTYLWDYPTTTLAQLATYNQVTKMDGTNTATAPTCVQNGADVNCSLKFTNLPNGSHVFTVSATLDGIEKVLSLTKTFPLTGGPTQPSNGRVTVTIIITVP